MTREELINRAQVLANATGQEHVVFIEHGAQGVATWSEWRRIGAPGRRIVTLYPTAEARRAHAAAEVRRLTA